MEGVAASEVEERLAVAPSSKEVVVVDSLAGGKPVVGVVAGRAGVFARAADRRIEEEATTQFDDRVTATRRRGARSSGRRGGRDDDGEQGGRKHHRKHTPTGTRFKRSKRHRTLQRKPIVTNGPIFQRRNSGFDTIFSNFSKEPDSRPPRSRLIGRIPTRIGGIRSPASSAARTPSRPIYP